MSSDAPPSTASPPADVIVDVTEVHHEPRHARDREAAQLPDPASAVAWRRSEADAPLRTLRTGSTAANMIVVTGTAGEHTR
jgi:hypothetical protein